MKVSVEPRSAHKEKPRWLAGQGRGLGVTKRREVIMPEDSGDKQGRFAKVSHLDGNEVVQIDAYISRYGDIIVTVGDSVTINMSVESAAWLAQSLIDGVDESVELIQKFLGRESQQ